jgi:N-acetylornithine carbamoyltransferase
MNEAVPRHFLATDDWPDEAILDLLDRAASIKRGAGSGSLAGRVLGLVFFNPSLRTRSSFEVAAARHGGTSIVVEPGRGAWAVETRPGVVMDGDAAEHVVEAARVLGRYVDVLGVRAFPSESSWERARRDDVLHSFARHAGVPVINLESARRHPCQGLADALTLTERLKPEPRGGRMVLAWSWHPKPLPTAVPVSAAIAAVRLGMRVTLACPPGYEFDPDDEGSIRAVAGRRGGMFETSHDLDGALEGADVVYAKSWGSLRHFADETGEAALRAGLRDWRIDERRMRLTHCGAGTFMHCLPVRRNVVVTDGVLDGPWSAVVEQAENRLHVQRALLLELAGTPIAQ